MITLVLGGVLLVVASALSLVVVVNAFRTRALDGVLCLFVPLYFYYYAFAKYSSPKKGVVLGAMLGSAVVGGALLGYSAVSTVNDYTNASKAAMASALSSAELAGIHAAAPAEDKAAEPGAGAAAAAVPAAPLVEIDLKALGKPFIGYVAMAPAGSKVELDDPSRNIVLSETDSVSLSAAPFWEDGVASTKKDKDNSNIQMVSPTEIRFERNPPLGKTWNVDSMIKVGKEKWSCGTNLIGTMSGAAMADQISAICKSIHKK